MTKRIVASQLAILTTPLLVARLASASPHIQGDGKCHYDVPNWSTIYADTGEIYSGGVLIGNMTTECAALLAESSGGVSPDTCPNVGASCTTNSQCCGADAGDGEICQSGSCCINQFEGQTCSQDSDCCSGSCSDYYHYCLHGREGYTLSMNANTLAYDGDGGVALQNAFNGILFYMTVGNTPEDPKDVNQTAYWAGFQGLGPPGDAGSPGMIVQPELWWQTNPGDNTGFWYLEAQVGINGGYAGTVDNTHTQTPGDQIEGTAFITEGNVETGFHGDEWVVTTQNISTGVEAVGINLITGLNGNGTVPKFTSANLGVIEAALSRLV